MQHETAPYVHPLHDKMRTEWMFWRYSYEGGRAYLKRYLSQHENELEPYFRRRVERGVYPNVVRNVVDTYTAHVFHESVAREDIAGLDEWHNDIDMQGTGADEFYRGVLTQAQIYGSCGVLTDRHEPDGFEPVTRAQEQEIGRRPYLVALAPPDIVDWSTDRFGRLRWLIHRDECSDEREPLQRDETANARFKLWTPTAWRQLEVRTRDGDEGGTVSEYVVVGEGTHPCGRVPIQFVYFGRRKTPHILGESAIKDLAPMGRRITNLTSLIDEQAYQHVFNILVVPGSTFESIKKANWSTAGCLTYEQDEGTPFYLAPEVDVITVLRSELNTTVQEARVLSGLGRQNEDSRAPVSGRSMAFQTMDKVALLRTMSERMAALEYEVDADMLAWMESPAEPVAAVYDTDFDPEALSAQLEEALLFDSFGIGGKARAETMKAITRSYLGPKLDADELAQVLDDIEARFMPTDGEDSPLGGVLGGGEVTALNGIQVRSLLETGAQVAAGELDAEAGVILITQAFGWDRATAERFIAAAAESNVRPVVEDSPPETDEDDADGEPEPATPAPPAN